MATTTTTNILRDPLFYGRAVRDCSNTRIRGYYPLYGFSFTLFVTEAQTASCRCSYVAVTILSQHVMGNKKLGNDLSVT